MHTNHLRNATQLLLALTAAVWLGGCASTPVPVAEMAVAEAAVKRARPPAPAAPARTPAEMQRASSKLAGARQALLNKDNEQARILAEQAQVDAQVAELLAQSVRSRKAAQESQDAARELAEELQRKTVR